MPVASLCSGWPKSERPCHYFSRLRFFCHVPHPVKKGGCVSVGIDSAVVWALLACSTRLHLGANSARGEKAMLPIALFDTYDYFKSYSWRVEGT